MSPPGRPFHPERTRDAQDGPSPQDSLIDRKAFLRRMAILSGAASLGPLTTTGPLLASQDSSQEILAGTTRRAGPSARTAPWPPTVAPAASTSASQATDPAELTLVEAATLIRRGHLSPVELVQAYLDRIDRYEGLLQAFNLVLGEEALEAARALERTPLRGPLHGIPLAIKDNFFTRGVRTTANSLIFQDFVPDYDATAVARLRDAGGIVLGKTQMGPLATTRASTPGGERTTVNAWAPFDPSVSPGGSSSGSATAVAARLSSSSTGTQTGGSITSPSMAQGLTGLKPTLGRVSLHGVIPLTYTRDHPGPIARDASDAAVMLQVMAGADPADPRTLGLPQVPDFVQAATPVIRDGEPRLRWPTTIGVIPGYTSPTVPEFAGQWEEALEAREDPAERDRQRERRRRRAAAEAVARGVMLRTMEHLGARVVEVELPADWETLTSREFNNVRLPERSEAFLEFLRRDVRLFGVSLSPWINGLLLSGDEYLRGQRAKQLLLRRVLEDLFAQCDVVVQTAPFPFDMIGLPLIAFPIGTEASAGMERPIGAMLGALPFGEERLLSVLAAYQATTDWHRARPPDPAGEVDPGSGDPGSRAASRGRIDAREVMDLTQ
jgi:Asp-tRNA(Asn)/Glu-tRNA(Gln) amidotransferase A subunit family amidase